VKELLVIGGVNVKDQISALNAGVSYYIIFCKKIMEKHRVFHWLRVIVVL
jgi:hypothetical protein